MSESESEYALVLRQKLVLLVEDDPVLLKTMAGWFAVAGCSVMSAPNGRVGLAQFERMRPDLVVTDIIMPEREGVETIMAMKALDRSVPVLAISGGGRIGPGEFLSLARTLGADGVLPKPFRSRELMSACAGLLDREPKAA